MQTFREIEADYFRQHPDEIDAYIKLILQEYAQHGDTDALLASLQALRDVKGGLSFNK
jgi:hypothetical protein